MYADSHKQNLIYRTCAIFFLIAMVMLVFEFTLCASGEYTASDKYVPGWVKIKFFQSYGYSWDQAPLEQQMRFRAYCERQKKQWKREDQVYKQKQKQDDQRLKNVKQEKEQFKKYLKTLKDRAAKKEAEKKANAAKQQAALKAIEQRTKNIIPQRTRK